MLQGMFNFVNTFFSHGIIHFFASQTFFSVILFILVFLLTRLLKKKSLFLVMGLWSFIFMRLVLPVNFSVPFSGRTLLQQTMEISSVAELPFFQEIGHHDLLKFDLAMNMSTGTQPNPSIEQLLFLVWSIGFIIISSIYWTRLQKYRTLLKRSAVTHDRQLVHLVDKWKRLFNIKRQVRILTGHKNISPFTLGVFKPVIYLPKCFIQQQDFETIESIIAHEMAHIKSGDDIWINLQNVIQMIYFYNPVVWLAGRQLHQVREQFCDVMVLSKQTLTKKTYGYGLLNAIQMNLELTDNLLVLPNFTNHKQWLVQRIQNIKRTGALSRTHILSYSVVLIVLGFFLLPMVNESCSGDNQTQDKPFVSPITDGVLVLEFGKDWDSGKKEYYVHKGIDIRREKIPASIVASGDGIVLSTGQDEIFNQYREVTIQHENGMQTRYLHLNTVDVKAHQTIKQGQIVGQTSFCVHFEVWKDDKILDPEQFLVLDKRLIRRIIKE
jgi:beta-lactamase regulating signal transducer with metallopeptidase domain